MLHPSRSSRPAGTLHQQRGFVLPIALIFLLLLSLLAVSASQHSLLQERIAGSFRQAQLARMSAETALRGAEYKLWSIGNHAGEHLRCTRHAISDDGCVVFDPLSAAYGRNGVVTQFQHASAWLDNLGVTYTGPAKQGYTTDHGQPTAVLAHEPVYLVEDLGIESRPAPVSCMKREIPAPAVASRMKSRCIFFVSRRAARVAIRTASASCKARSMRLCIDRSTAC